MQIVSIKPRVDILISVKIDFKTNITSDKQGNFVMIKWSIHQRDIKVINMYLMYNVTTNA